MVPCERASKTESGTCVAAFLTYIPLSDLARSRESRTVRFLSIQNGARSRRAYHAATRRHSARPTTEGDGRSHLATGMQCGRRQPSYSATTHCHKHHKSSQTWRGRTRWQSACGGGHPPPPCEPWPPETRGSMYSKARYCQSRDSSMHALTEHGSLTATPRRFRGTKCLAAEAAVSW